MDTPSKSPSTYIVLFGVVFAFLYALFFFFSLVSLYYGQETTISDLIFYVRIPFPMGMEVWQILTVLALLSIVYAILLFVVRHRIVQHHLSRIIYFSVLFHIVALLALPMFSSDVTGYIARASLITNYHVNPYQVAPSEAGPTLISNWWENRMPYGPLWAVLSSFVKIYSSHFVLNIFIFRLFVIFFNFGCMFLIYRILKKMASRFSDVGLLLYAWNPFIVLEVANNGHNDIILVFFLLLAIYLLLERRMYLAFASLTLAFLIKYSVIVAFPLFLIYSLKDIAHMKEKILRFFRIVLIVLGIAVITSLPFLSRGFFSGLSQHTQIEVTASAGQIVFASLLNTEPADIFEGGMPTAAGILNAAAFLFFYVVSTLWYLVRSNHSAKSFMGTLVCTFGALLFFYPLSSFQSWYYLWILGPALLWGMGGGNRYRVHIVLLITFIGLLQYVFGPLFAVIISFLLTFFIIALDWLFSGAKQQRGGHILSEGNIAKP